MPLVALILMLKTMGKVEDTTATAAAIFFFARLAHAITYAMGTPWVRPVFFTVGWLVNCYLLWKVLSQFSSHGAVRPAEEAGLRLREGRSKSRLARRETRRGQLAKGGCRNFSNL